MWGLSVGVFAYIVGVISNSISSAGISKNLQQELEKLGSGSILTPSGYIGFTFIFFILVVSLFVVGRSARRVTRRRTSNSRRCSPYRSTAGPGSAAGSDWPSGAAFGISMVAGFVAWAGAESSGVHLSLGRMLEAGLNCMPVAVLFLGVAALLYALVPRASAGIAYAAVVVAFLWQLFGSLLGAPKWLVDITPFQHIGFVPGQSFQVQAAVVMALVGVACGGLAVWAFARRDLLGA